jgi:biopolymer transport protein ExbB
MIDFFFKGGALMWPILFCSVVALGLMVAKGLQLWGVSARLVHSVGELMADKPAVIAPILDAVERGLDEKQISLIGTRQIRELEKGLGVLSLISTIAPLLGFTGTVTGMIQAFMVIASHSGGRVEPAMVAGGIYEALITTAGGLFVAIPTHVAVHYLEDRLDEIALRLQSIALTLYEGRKHGI